MLDDLVVLRHTAIGLLARREHSQQELYHKLERRGFSTEGVTMVLQQLVDKGLLSDERFAEAYVRMRSQRGYGPQRIRGELHERGVDERLITTAIRDQPTDWHRLASQVRVKRFGQESPSDHKERARQMRFLQYRGFEQEQLRSVFSVESE